MNKLLTLAVATALSLGAVGSASAATATGTLSPQASVQAACAITSTALDFGTLGGVVQSNVDATGTINLSCTANLPYTITANGGVNTAKVKVPGRRAMTAGAASTGLDYDLFTSAARTTKLDSSAGSIAGTSGASGGSSAVSVFGRVYSGQTYSEAVGAVSDTVGLTITF